MEEKTEEAQNFINLGVVLNDKGEVLMIRRVQPDYVSGLEVVKKDSRFLDYQDQIEILNSVLSSVKLF